MKTGDGPVLIKGLGNLYPEKMYLKQIINPTPELSFKLI